MMDKRDIQDECRRVYADFLEIIHTDGGMYYRETGVTRQQAIVSTMTPVIDPMIERAKNAIQAIVNATVKRMVLGVPVESVVKYLNHLRHDAWTHREFDRPIRLMISLMILHLKKGDLLDFLAQREVPYPATVPINITPRNF